MCNCPIERELKPKLENYIVGKTLKIKECCFYSLIKKLLEEKFGNEAKGIIEWQDSNKHETWEDNIKIQQQQYEQEHGSLKDFIPPKMPKWIQKRLQNNLQGK